MRVNPILELRIKGANVEEQSNYPHSDGNSSNIHSVRSNRDIDDEQFEEKVTEII
jgi:hypothetical protein